MLPFVAVLGQDLCGAFYSLLSRRLSVRLARAQLQLAAVMLTFTFALGLPFALLHGGVEVSALARWWPCFLLGGVASALSVTVNLLVFRYLDAAMGTLLGTTYIVLSIASAMYVLGERLGLRQIIGALIALAAVAYALSVHVNRRERRNWTLGMLVTLVGAVLFSVAVVVEKFLLVKVGVSSYVAWGWGAQWLCATVLATLVGGHHFGQIFAKRNRSLVIGAGCTRTAMALLFVSTLVIFKSLCVAVVLAGLRPLFVAFLGAWFLHERKFLARKIMASVAAAIGVAIMFW